MFTPYRLLLALLMIAAAHVLQPFAALLVAGELAAFAVFVLWFARVLVRRAWVFPPAPRAAVASSARAAR